MTIKRYQVGESVSGWPVDSWDQVADFVEGDKSRDQRYVNGVPLAAGIFLLVQPSVTIKQRGIVTIGTIYADPNETENDISGNPVEINKSYLQQSPVFAASAPVDGDSSPGVAFEPIGDNPGWVMVSGVAWALVDITDSDHGYCQVIDGDTTKFASAESGIKIKWKPTGTGEKICAVLLCLNTDFAEPPEAPLGDPPVASGTVTASGGTLFMEETSTPETPQSIISDQWTVPLPSSHTLILSGLVGSAPNYVYDSRGTLSLSDVGGAIVGNIEDLEIDETAGGLSTPYTAWLTSTQTDTQSHTVEIEET